MYEGSIFSCMISVGGRAPVAMVIYLQKVLIEGHTADLHLAGQPQPCRGHAPVREPMHNDALIAVQVGLAHVKNRLC